MNLKDLLVISATFLVLIGGPIYHQTHLRQEYIEQREFILEADKNYNGFVSPEEPEVYEARK